MGTGVGVGVGTTVGPMVAQSNYVPSGVGVRVGTTVRPMVGRSNFVDSGARSVPSVSGLEPGPAIGSTPVQAAGTRTNTRTGTTDIQFIG